MNKSAIVVLAILMACTQSRQPIEKIETHNKYPSELNKIFDRHGSISTWQQKKSLSYEIVGEDMNEKQFIDLRNRRERIEAANFITGYDGENIWLEADSTYDGDAVFYHNLMFYFYAMPFVLGDDGINYDTADSLSFEGKLYPGIKITYGSEIGNSPEDEYYLHYDPDTYQMTWLGYTVTYFSGEKSKDVRWVRYNDWVNQQGLLMPKSMTWYKYEDEKLTEPRGTAVFENVSISEKALHDSTFQRTKNATILK